MPLFMVPYILTAVMLRSIPTTYEEWVKEQDRLWSKYSRYGRG